MWCQHHWQGIKWKEERNKVKSKMNDTSENEKREKWQLLRTDVSQKRVKISVKRTTSFACDISILLPAQHCFFCLFEAHPPSFSCRQKTTGFVTPIQRSHLRKFNRQIEKFRCRAIVSMCSIVSETHNPPSEANKDKTLERWIRMVIAKIPRVTFLRRFGVAWARVEVKNERRSEAKWEKVPDNRLTASKWLFGSTTF